MKIDPTEWRRQFRLELLSVLARLPGYSAHDGVLMRAVRDHGFGATRDQVRTELQWLAEQGLATNETLDQFIVATATQRGVDVAQGYAFHDGVDRPLPEQ